MQVAVYVLSASRRGYNVVYGHVAEREHRPAASADAFLPPEKNVLDVSGAYGLSGVGPDRYVGTVCDIGQHARTVAVANVNFAFQRVPDQPERHFFDVNADPLAAGKVVELGLASSMSHEGVRKRLKKTLKPWQKKEWCIPKVSAEFVANMEDVLDLYAEPYDPQRPVVCFDETSTQLLAETRPSLPPRPGLPLRQDYEYRREGTRNLFLACEPLAGWRQVAVTQRRTMADFAHQMRWLVDEAYPETSVVRFRIG